MTRALSGDSSGWTLTDFLLSDIFHALSGEPHPNRPKGGKKKGDVAAKTKRLQEQQARLATRRQAASE